MYCTFHIFIIVFFSVYIWMMSEINIYYYNYNKFNCHCINLGTCALTLFWTCNSSSSCAFCSLNLTTSLGDSDRPSTSRTPSEGTGSLTTPTPPAVLDTPPPLIVKVVWFLSPVRLAIGAIMLTLQDAFDR